jgi:uncharacterized protein
MQRPARRAPGETRQAVEAALADVLANEPGVLAAYLFGSLATGTAGPLSDVDVALLVADDHDADGICSRSMDELCRRLHTSRVDVVSLRAAPMPLRFRVIRDGVLIASRDAAAVQRFVAGTVLQYLDVQPLRDRAFRLVREAIIESR